MRLIDADELKKDIDGYDYSEEGYSDRMDFKFIYEVIDNQPTVEAKPVVHGEWKRIGSCSLYDTYECTNCHRQPKWDCLGDNHWRIAFTDICPHCGARMDGADMRGGKNGTL